MEPSISKSNMKMGKIPSFSLMKGVTCPKDAPCRERCYISKALRLYEKTRNAYNVNTELMRTLGGRKYVQRRIELYLRKHDTKYFRWNVSGDFNIPYYFDLVVRIAKEFPKTKFLAFTKCFNVVTEYKKRRKQCIPENLNIIYSVWGDYAPKDAGDFTDRSYAFYYKEGETKLPPKPVKFLCSEQTVGKKCDECGLCWKLKAGASVVFKDH